VLKQPDQAAPSKMISSRVRNAQDPVDGPFQIGQTTWLGEILNGALGERIRDGRRIAVPAEHNHLKMAMGRFEPGYELPTVPSRQRSVNHGNMEMLLACGVQRLIRTTHANDAHPAAREAADQDF
jgi:hypothetical protein